MRLANQPGVVRLGRYLYLENNYPEIHGHAGLDVMLLVPWHEELPRERRRRDKQRMKAKARRTFAGLTPLDFWRSGEDRERWLKDCEKLADNLAHCQRRCCNRARDWDGPSVQERRWAAAQPDGD